MRFDWLQQWGHPVFAVESFVDESQVRGTCYRVCRFENTCRKLTQRQLKALGCQRNEKTGRYEPPSDSTFRRVLMRVEASALASIVGGWLGGQEIGVLARLAVDGKVLRGSGRHDGRPVQILSAVTHQLRLTLDPIPIAAKSNEIPALAPLLERVRPRPSTLITADASRNRPGHLPPHKWSEGTLALMASHSAKMPSPWPDSRRPSTRTGR